MNDPIVYAGIDTGMWRAVIVRRNREWKRSHTHQEAPGEPQHPTHGPTVALTAVSAVVLSLGLAACGGDDGDGGDSGDGGDEPVEITIATFNEFGYEDLIEEWNAANPDIQVTQKKVGTWDDAKENLYTKLAAGSGLSDIEAIEGDAMPAILAESDAFVDLTDPELDGRWLDFKAAAATNADGQMIGYGTDAGPEGICYRADLFEKAGLPTDREEVAALMGTWEDYFATGEEFVKKVPGTAWYDSTGGTAQAMLNQVENPFEQSDNTIDVENAELAGRLRHLDRQRRQGPVHQAHPVERRLDRLVPEGRLRHHGLPGLDARRGRPATPTASRAGTSPTSSPAAAATGAARSWSCRSSRSTPTRPRSSRPGSPRPSSR